MSVIIKSMKMPKNCGECKLARYKTEKDMGATISYVLSCTGQIDPVYIPLDCPLVELPEKHGRLIDGDYLYNRLKALGLKDENVFRIIKEEPTVVESEE